MSTPEPTQVPNLEQPKFGFNEYAERLNGRAAMVGFVLTLVIEYFSKQGLLSWLGLKQTCSIDMIELGAYDGKKFVKTR